MQNPRLRTVYRQRKWPLLATVHKIVALGRKIMALVIASCRAREWEPEAEGRGLLSREITLSRDHHRPSAAKFMRVCMTAFASRCVYFLPNEPPEIGGVSDCNYCWHAGAGRGGGGSTGGRTRGGPGPSSGGVQARSPGGGLSLEFL